MPGVKKLFQESENSAKPEYIHGHMFGGLGILAGNERSWACIPLSIRLHDGLQAAREWKDAAVSSRWFGLPCNTDGRGCLSGCPHI